MIRTVIKLVRGQIRPPGARTDRASAAPGVLLVDDVGVGGFRS